MAKPRTNAYQQEIVEVFYGINRKAKRVERVSRTRDGMLSKWGADAILDTQHVMPGRDVKKEIAIVFGLTDVFGFAPGEEDEIFVEQRRKELEKIIANLGSE